MQKYEIQRADSEPLVFESDLLGTTRAADYVTEEGARSYELSLYALADGGYVISIASSSCSNDQFVLETS